MTAPALPDFGPPVALPDGILPPALAYGMGLAAHHEGRFVHDCRLGWCGEEAPLALTEEHPRRSYSAPTVVRDLIRGGG